MVVTIKLCNLKLLEVAEKWENDFRLVFDSFDDLVVLNSADVPTEIRLYQLKSKDPGEWTVAELCRKEGRIIPRSYVSRLYSHIETFGPFVAETGFVSNAPYKVLLASGERTSGEHHRIQGAELHGDEVKKINEAVVSDFSLADVPGWLPKLVLIRTTLGVHGQDLVMKGRLHDYFQKLGYVDVTNLSPVYETLHASIEQRTGFHQAGLDLIRGICTQIPRAAEFLEIISIRAVQRRRGFLSDWDIIQIDLDKQGCGTRKMIRLKTSAIKYHQERQSGQPQAVRLKARSNSWWTYEQASITAIQSIHLHLY